MVERAAKGLADVVAASTAISDSNGRAGTLSYRGYDIHQLAGRSSFEEVAHLLQRGTLPGRDALAAFRAELAAARALGPATRAVLPVVAQRCEPMAALRTLVSALAADDPEAGDDSAPAGRRKAARLLAQVPLLVAGCAAARAGTDLPDPDPDLSLAGNLLWQLSGSRPDPTRAAVLDECLVLHADHAMNASTFAARVCAATRADLHAAVTAAVGTLSGPLHGGGTGAVLALLDEVGSAGAAPAAVRARLGEDGRLPGFGHRTYRGEDPRTRHLRALSGRLAAGGDAALHQLSAAVEAAVAEVAAETAAETAAEADPVAAALRPNADFWSVAVYQGLGIPAELFVPVFAVARTAGWTAHVLEQHADNRLIRPEASYIGPRRQVWMPIQERL